MCIIFPCVERKSITLSTLHEKNSHLWFLILILIFDFDFEDDSHQRDARPSSLTDDRIHQLPSVQQNARKTRARHTPKRPHVFCTAKCQEGPQAIHPIIDWELFWFTIQFPQ